MAMAGVVDAAAAAATIALARTSAHPSQGGDPDNEDMVTDLYRDCGYPELAPIDIFEHVPHKTYPVRKQQYDADSDAKWVAEPLSSDDELVKEEDGQTPQHYYWPHASTTRQDRVQDTYILAHPPHDAILRSHFIGHADDALKEETKFPTDTSSGTTHAALLVAHTVLTTASLDYALAPGVADVAQAASSDLLNAPPTVSRADDAFRDLSPRFELARRPLFVKAAPAVTKKPKRARRETAPGNPKSIVACHACTALFSGSRGEENRRRHWVEFPECENPSPKQEEKLLQFKALPAVQEVVDQIKEAKQHGKRKVSAERQLKGLWEEYDKEPEMVVDQQRLKNVLQGKHKPRKPQGEKSKSQNGVPKAKKSRRK
ncbi:hypothetical protein MKEN_01069100 [Mycena kentingensis (nom. inval.)]|nr:hypothetical protein MKEN_01069100 [Mycena kentingensis (nom. inval.)]